MFVPRAGQNFTLDNPPHSRSTPTKRRKKWRPYASFIAEECRKSTSSEAIRKMLAEQHNFEVTLHQLNRYKRTARLCRPNIRSTRRDVSIATFTRQARDSDGDDEPISDVSTSSSAYASSSGDHDDAYAWMTGSEQVISSEADDSQYETANEAFEAVDHARDRVEASPERYGIPAMISHPTGTWQEELLTPNMSDGQNEFTRGSDRQAFRSYTNLSFSPSVSPPQSVQSAYRRREKRVYTGGLGSRPLTHCPRQAMEDCSPTTSIRTWKSRSTTSSHRTNWVYPSQKAKWSGIVNVGEVLDVREPAMLTQDGIHSRTYDSRQRKHYKRIVVVRVDNDVFYGVPVRTYRARGTIELEDPQRQEHAILHAEGMKATLIPGEPEMIKRPLVVQLSSISSKLSAASRINFASTCFFKAGSGVIEVGKLNPLSICFLESYWKDHLEAASAP